jgi:hypothetical protein
MQHAPRTSHLSLRALSSQSVVTPYLLAKNTNNQSHTLSCSDADALCMHITTLSSTAAHSVINPLAVVQTLLQVTSAAGFVV